MTTIKTAAKTLTQPVGTKAILFAAGMLLGFIWCLAHGGDLRAFALSLVDDAAFGIIFVVRKFWTFVR